MFGSVCVCVCVFACAVDDVIECLGICLGVSCFIVAFVRDWELCALWLHSYMYVATIGIFDFFV